MTREEQIMNDPNLQCYIDKDREWIHEAFRDGVSWADSHPEDETDWQKVRIQAAIAAMQGICANEVIQRDLDKTFENADDIFSSNAKLSIRFADALIKELKIG